MAHKSKITANLADFQKTFADLYSTHYRSFDYASRMANSIIVRKTEQGTRNPPRLDKNTFYSQSMRSSEWKIKWMNDWM